MGDTGILGALIGGALALGLGVAFAAAIGPTRRAIRVQPVEVLRAD